MHAIRPSWPRWLAAALVLSCALLLLWLLAYWRGPSLPGYQVIAGPLVQDVVATGRVATPSRIQIRPEITGLVLERRVMEGDRVAPGDLLVRQQARDLEARRDQAQAVLDTLLQAELPEARARLHQARSQLAQAEQEHARRRAAAEQARLAVAALAGGARQAQALEELAAAEAALARTELRASTSGTVLSRHVEPGDTVVPGDLLLLIAADAGDEILLPVDEKNLSRLALGQTATGIADAWPDRPFSATVHHIAPGIDASRGTVDVRLRIDPGADYLRQDMTVTPPSAPANGTAPWSCPMTR